MNLYASPGNLFSERVISVSHLARIPATFLPCRSRSDQLLAPLKQYFGFGSFRPLQEDIIRDALAGKDVFAVLPTGGGKSLRFQLRRWCGPDSPWSFRR